MRPTSAGSNVAPSADPHGNSAAVTLVKLWPRAPTGPSVTRIAGTPWSGRAWVFQSSWPAVNAARSSRSSCVEQRLVGPWVRGHRSPGRSRRQGGSAPGREQVIAADLGGERTWPGLTPTTCKRFHHDTRLDRSRSHAGRRRRGLDGPAARARRQRGRDHRGRRLGRRRLGGHRQPGPARAPERRPGDQGARRRGGLPLALPARPPCLAPRRRPNQHRRHGGAAARPVVLRQDRGRRRVGAQGAELRPDRLRGGRGGRACAVSSRRRRRTASARTA